MFSFRFPLQKLKHLNQNTKFLTWVYVKADTSLDQENRFKKESEIETPLGFSFKHFI